MTTNRCPNFNSGYCPDHDYDHVLERAEYAGFGLVKDATIPVRREAIAYEPTTNSMWAEASTIGFSAGFWPSRLTIARKDGGVAIFDRAYNGDIDGEGELRGYRYIPCSSGLPTLFVAND